MKSLFFFMTLAFVNSAFANTLECFSLRGNQTPALKISMSKSEDKSFQVAVGYLKRGSVDYIEEKFVATGSVDESEFNLEFFSAAKPNAAVGTLQARKAFVPNRFDGMLKIAKITAKTGDVVYCGFKK